MPVPYSLDIRPRFQRVLKTVFPAVRRRAFRCSRLRPVRSSPSSANGGAYHAGKCRRPVGCGKLGPYKNILLEGVTQNPDIALREWTGTVEAEGIVAHKSQL